jgi:hypothetical protein
MRYKKISVNKKEYFGRSEIEFFLKKYNLHWVLNAEIEDADLEIENRTLIWNSGDWLYGKWFFGIFKGGVFHGVFENGIFSGGTFKGKWVSGIDLTKKIVKK